MDKDLMLVSNPRGSNNCILICGDDPNRIEWACARFDTCGSRCTAGANKVWIKQTDLPRYVALRLVS